MVNSLKLAMLEGDVFERFKEIPDESIDLIITSRPYWGLRAYMKDEPRELGREETMESYLDNMIREVKEEWRVLKPTGSLVHNIGDCFCGGGSSSINKGSDDKKIWGDRPGGRNTIKEVGGIYKEKQLLSVSSFAYCRIVSETDFVCRGEHVWCKPNVPSPIRCRLKHSHEKLFWFVKNADRYYFDAKAWMKPISEVSANRIKYARSAQKTEQGTIDRELAPGWCQKDTIENSWRVNPCGSKQNGFELSGRRASEHVAPFPEELIRPYIKSLCPQGGVILDPFMGSGTTMRVAMEEGRSCGGIELNPASIAYAKKRVNWGSGLNCEYSGGWLE